MNPVHGKRSEGKYKTLSNLTLTEKKQWRRDQRRRYNDTRVRIGDQLERWGFVKNLLGLSRKSDPEFAQFLLDRAVVNEKDDSEMHVTVSSSSTEQQHTSRKRPREDSEEPGGSKHTQENFVSLEYVQDGDVVHMAPTAAQMEETAEEADFSDDNMETEEDGSTLYQLLEQIDECHPEGGKYDVALEDIFDIEHSTNTVQTHKGEANQQPGVDVKTLAGEETFLGYTTSLQQLLGDIPVATCPIAQCGCVPQAVTKTIGTALTVKWVCKNGHNSKTWSSQPKIHGNFAGDVGLSSAIVLSGSNLPKVRMMCRCLNLGTCSQVLHDYIQRVCTFPSVTSYWERMQRSLLDERRYQKITITAGASRAHEQSSSYFPYTSLDYTTGDILNVSTIDKRKSQQDYGILETEAFTEMMDLVKNNSITVQEVVTDAQQHLKEYMCQHPSILHSFDVWPVAKNMGRKVAMASQRSEFYRPLELWTADVTKHFLFCAEQAAGDRMRFIAHWRGILHHVVGNHEWGIDDQCGPSGCLHDPIPKELENERLLHPSSLSHEALREIVLNEKLIWNLDNYSRNRHRKCLERFWPYLDAYVDDHVTYSHSSYKVRNLLAAIDYQLHKDRGQQMRDGKLLFKRQYSRRTKKWVKVPDLEKKTYTYIPELMQEILMKCLVKDEKQCT